MSSSPPPPRRLPPTAPGGAPWPRVFLLVVVGLLLILAAIFLVLYSPVDRRNPWLSSWRRHLERVSPGDGLHHLVEGLEMMQWEELQRHRDALKRVALGRPASERVLILVGRHQAVIERIRLLARTPALSLPPALEAASLDRRPDVESLELLSWLLLANARILESAGEPIEALQRLQEATVLGARLTRPAAEASLTQHVAGVLLMEGALAHMVALVPRLGLEPWQRAGLAAQLERAEAELHPVVDALAGEGLRLQALLDAPTPLTAPALATILQYYDSQLPRGEALATARRDLGQAASFPQGRDKFLAEIGRVLSLPHHEQPRITPEWMKTITDNPIVELLALDIEPLRIRQTLVRARIALLLAYCRGESAGLPADPFTGLPLRQAPGRLYSVGPDGNDNGGTVVYDPMNGWTSEGDLILIVDPK